MKDLPAIPPSLSHLKVDHRGYPIPWFVPWVDGKPEFRFLDQKKRNYCIDQKLCPICGKKLDVVFYFISGPLGFTNRIGTDTAMHETCARYSLEVCPHLFFQEADRRRTENDPNAKQAHSLSGQVVGKPKELYLSKCTKFKTVTDPDPRVHDKLIKYFPVSAERYTYTEGRLDFSTKTIIRI